ncbi:MAG: hypothetical protein MJK04_08835, partial [Psychrosphaera sp.]|nr:hypothetical protein [Psychrosphaera sp.]
LTGGQTYFDRNYADDPATSFYRFGSLDNVYLCGSGTYPCGSVAGTPGYMCSQQLVDNIRLCTNSGLALGSTRFKQESEQLTGCRVTKAQRGRPKKSIF